MATTNSQGVYNYGLILFESVLTVVCILGKASWTLSPWWLSPQGQSLTRQLLYNPREESRFVLRILLEEWRWKRPWLGLFPVGLGQRGDYWLM